MKKQKRYASERAILADIYKVERQIIELSGQHKAEPLYENKQKLLRSIERLESKKGALRRTQDAFCTATLPGITVPSVVIQNP